MMSLMYTSFAARSVDEDVLKNEDTVVQNADCRDMMP